MNSYHTKKQFFALLIVMIMGLLVLWPQVSHAERRCEEKRRTCLDAGSRPITVVGGTFYQAPPVIPGYASACWRWQKEFRCIETNPILWCESGNTLDQVKRTCNLVSSTIKATERINAITYVTDAEYRYRCNWQNWTTTDRLPTGKECVMLDNSISDTGTVPGAPLNANPYSGNPPRATSLTQSVVTDQLRVEEYVCYSPPTHLPCSDTCYKNFENPATGQVETRQVACESPVTNCIMSNDQCDHRFSGNTPVMAKGPDGRCISQTTSYLCEGGPVPRCLEQENCVLDSTRPGAVQDNGVAMTQEQNYICTNETASCAELSEVNNCVTVAAWGWDRLQHRSTSGDGLGEFNEAMAKLDAIQKGLNDNDPHIFSGQDLRCRYAVGNFLNTMIAVAMVAAAALIPGAGLMATAIQQGALAAVNAGAISLTQFATVYANAQTIAAVVSIGSAAISDAPNSKALGSNCCKDHVIEGSDAWYKFGSCTADEVKLSVARQKGLYHYLGEYCSKRSGFPVRQCVQKTKTYCVFDDMLALVINKQGRMQLDDIAAADPTTAILTNERSFQLFAPATGSHAYAGVMDNGSWQHLENQGGNTVWYWQYPGYCRAPNQQASAYARWEAEINAAVDTKGIQPKNYTQNDAWRTIGKIVMLKPFQECAETPGMMYFMTCSTGTNCDTSKLPEGPTGTLTDLSGADVSEADVRWRVQQVRTDYLPGQYGVTNRMSTNPSFAAVSHSLNSHVSSVGSCQSGNCLFRFVFTNRGANGGAGARKRIMEYAQFPLYTLNQNPTYPSVDYVGPNGEMDPGVHAADPNRGLGSPIDLNNHRFIFRPNFKTTEPKGNMHSHVLLEWSRGGGPDSFRPVLVPTNLAAGTPGFWPHGNAGVNTEHFYISGSCDHNSRWCNYQLEANLNVERHPWGSPKQPRCWGFTIQQVAALDFDAMDLSEWLNSLDLSSMSEGLSEEAAEAMANQVMATANAHYGAFSAGETINSPLTGVKAIHTNADILPVLSQEAYKAYTLKLAVTSNWPQYYEDEPNLNPVSNVWVDWGDGSPKQQMHLHPEGRAYYAEFDYGDLEAKEYKITVTLEAANHGPQTLATYVRITPNPGEKMKKNTEPNFTDPTSVGKYPGMYTPSRSIDGTDVSPNSLETLSPGTVKQFEMQGGQVTPPK